MQHIVNPSQKRELESLFISSFTDSAGAEEGALIGKLVSQLAAGIDDTEILCFAHYEGNTLAGAIFFTRLQFQHAVKVYMLAPVAVRTAYQRQGVGKALINYGLEQLKQRAVDVAVTYGDPAYYTKMGFSALSETVIQAPLTLSMPFGWLGQSLTAEPIVAINERPECVKPFNDPVYW